MQQVERSRSLLLGSRMLGRCFMVRFLSVRRVCEVAGWALAIGLTGYRYNLNAAAAVAAVVLFHILFTNRIVEAYNNSRFTLTLYMWSLVAAELSLSVNGDRSGYIIGVMTVATFSSALVAAFVPWLEYRAALIRERFFNKQHRTPDSS